MIKQFNYDAFGHLEYPDIILSTRYHKHLGRIKTIDYSTLNLNFNMNAAQEISFDVYKKFNDIECDNWDSIIDLKYIYVPEYREYFCIEVTTSDTDKTVKHITGKSACEYELSNRKLYNFECNTEDDILRDDYVPTIICNPDNHDASLLHRVIKDKCPDYTIGHVDESIAKLQRTFSANDKDIYSFLTDDVAKEVECLFIFDSVNRTISVYDLKNYGENTGVHISVENYADEISISGNPDSRFNCLKISGGDNLMTATVANINPNGTSYIYSFSDDMLADMPSYLVERIKSYNTLYNDLQPTYKEYTNKIYDLIDRLNYLKSEMMPEIVIPTTTAQQEATKLRNELTLVEVQNINSLSKTSSDSAVKGMANVIVDSRYNIEINASALSDVTDNARIWQGTIKITNQGNEDDTFTIEGLYISIRSDDYEKYTYQKIQKLLSRKDTVFVDVFDIEDIDTFKSELKKYCLDRLKSFESSYQGCLDVLIEQGVTDGNTEIYGVNLYETMYKPYRERMALVQAEMVVRESEIASVQSEYDDYSVLKCDIQEQLNFRKYIGDDLWLTFSHYLQEDIYANDNYVSDGLSNSELIARASELFEKATEEVQKACEPQYTLTSTLQNLFHRKEFEPFRDKVALGNWINFVADDTVYKLRLISLELKFDSLDKIPVSFSNVEKVKNVISDAESVLSQAKSIAGSFNYVARQASQGNNANVNIKNWLTDGLNSALVQIKNNNQEEITYDEHGLLARSYDDVTDLYSSEQLKITHNCLAYTNDNWMTVCTALGKQQYIYYDENKNDFVSDIDFGLNSKFVQAGFIYGSQIIGGDIYSDNYSSDSGTHLNLRDGTFSFAGGKLKYIDDVLSIEGDIIATSIKASNGTIGKFNLGDALYSGTNSMISTTPGIYIGTDGIRQYNSASQYVNIQNGILSCNGANIKGNIETSYIIASGGKICGDLSIQDKIKMYIKEYDKYFDLIKTSYGYFEAEVIGGIVEICEPLTNKTIISIQGGTEAEATELNPSYQCSIHSNLTIDGETYIYGQTYARNDLYVLGTTYLSSSPIVGSDSDIKKDIKKLDIDKTLNFIYALTPVQYKYKINQSNRYHHGLIAQDVKNIMGDDDWGLYIDKNIETGENGGKALRYEELIADLIITVQSQNERIKELESR